MAANLHMQTCDRAGAVFPPARRAARVLRQQLISLPGPAHEGRQIQNIYTEPAGLLTIYKIFLYLTEQRLPVGKQRLIYLKNIISAIFNEKTDNHIKPGTA